MQRRSRTLLAGSVLALFAAVALALWGLGRAYPQQVVRRPNGEVLRLEAVTYGASQQWAPRAWWQRLLGPLGPQPASSSAYRPQFYAFGGSQQYLIFWFSGPSSPLRGVRSQGHVFAADDTGREYARA